MTYVFQCRCGVIVEDVCPAAVRKKRKKCPECGKMANRCYHDPRTVGRNAKTGEKRSAIAGCGFGQEEQGTKALVAAGIDARYEKGSGDLIAGSRRDFLKAVELRGMHSNTDGLLRPKALQTCAG